MFCTMSGCNCRPRRVYLPPKAQMTKALLAWIVQSCGRELELLPLTEMEEAPPEIWRCLLQRISLLSRCLAPDGLYCRHQAAAGAGQLWRAPGDLFRQQRQRGFYGAQYSCGRQRGPFEIVGIGLIGRVRLNGMADRGAVLPAIAAAAAALTAGVPFAIMMDALNSFPASAYLG